MKKEQVMRLTTFKHVSSFITKNRSKIIRQLYLIDNELFLDNNSCNGFVN